MLLEKIEKYSRPSILAVNSPQSRASLQSCFYNLSNLQKIVQGSHSVSQGKMKLETYKHAPLLNSNSKLPQISSITFRNSQFYNSSSNQVSFNESLKQNKMMFGGNTNSIPISPMDTSLMMTVRKFRRQTEIENRDRRKSGNIKMISQTIESENKTKHRKAQHQKIVRIRHQRREGSKLGLQKKQKYFEEEEVKIDTKVVEKIGLYQAANIYKASNVSKFLKQGYESKLKPIINLKFATFSMCNRNQFFLTDNMPIPELQQVDSYLQEIRKQVNLKSNSTHLEIKHQQESKNTNDVVMETEENQSEKSEISEEEDKRMQWLISIQDYQVQKNQQYFGLKKNNIEDWGEISYILYQICQYMKRVKISLLSFKFDKQIFMREMWSCRRIPDKVMQKMLKIKINVGTKVCSGSKTARVFSSKAEIITELLKVWRSRKKLLRKRREKQKENERIIWTAIRITAMRKMMLARKKRTARIQMINEKLRKGEWDYDIQIHIPSFSESQFVRNTTQYMEHYQNIFYHIWKSTNKQFVLIIPAINETLLKMLQQKIKLNKNITLICPQSHELYPKTLPLSANLLYSKQALYKLKCILQNKRGIIIPGRQISAKYPYQEQLSDILNCPLYSTLHFPRQHKFHKEMWINYGVPTAKHMGVQPKSSMKFVIERLGELVYENPRVPVWLLKINNEFNGRGIAIFDVGSSKKMKEILQLMDNTDEMPDKDKINPKRKREIKDLLISYLDVHFRLKLKINFENYIFRVEQYIETFLEKGGIIQEFVEGWETYELCYKLEPGYSSNSGICILDEIEEGHICCAQNYEVDFVTKSTVFMGECMPKSVRELSKKLYNILKKQKFLGYVSISVLHCPKSEFNLAIDVKPYMTINASMSYMLRVFTQKKYSNWNFHRKMGSASNSNINSLIEMTNHEMNNNKLIFLFIPCIIFTDVDQETRSNIIENLVTISWAKMSNKLLDQKVCLTNSDTFQGNLYMSLGLTLGILFFGRPTDLKRMKNKAIECVRELADKSEFAKLYRGKQQPRDVFQFGDLIRAVTKIKDRS